MKVFVIYDPLYERVVCVHEEYDMECDACKNYGDNNGYGLSETEYEVVPGKQTIRENKINQIL